jgi:type IV pilus assembly protein PilV
MMNMNATRLRDSAVRGLRSQRGASLLEVLVAILILSFGMLSMAGLHSVAFKYGKMSQFRGVATQYASDLADRMRANPVAAREGDYVFTEAYSSTPATVDLPACGTDTACSSVQMAARDIGEVRLMIQSGLPGGGLYVTQDAAQENVYTVWVMWLDPDSVGGADDGDTASFAGLCPDEAVGGADPRPQCMPVRVAL